MKFKITAEEKRAILKRRKLARGQEVDDNAVFISKFRMECKRFAKYLEKADIAKESLYFSAAYAEHHYKNLDLLKIAQEIGNLYNRLKEDVITVATEKEYKFKPYYPKKPVMP